MNCQFSWVVIYTVCKSHLFLEWLHVLKCHSVSLKISMDKVQMQI